MPKIMKDLETPVSKARKHSYLKIGLVPARFPPKALYQKNGKSLLNCLTFSAFTGLWISASLMVSCRILCANKTTCKRSFLDLAALVPSGMITIQRISVI